MTIVTIILHDAKVAIFIETQVDAINCVVLTPNWIIKIPDSQTCRDKEPARRGLGKRNLYNMVKFYDTYCAEHFLKTVSELQLPEFVQLRIAQIGTPSKSAANEIAQFPMGDFFFNRCDISVKNA